MDHYEYNPELNQLLIDLGRSLLQYVGECWPWTGTDGDDDGDQERTVIHQLVARQHVAVAQLADLLANRHWPIDFGTYPTEYTDLHYMALDFLLGQLIANERSLISELEAGIETTRYDDPQAAELLRDIISQERDNLAELQKLAAPRATGSAV